MEQKRSIWIVVSVIILAVAFLVSISVPNLLRSRMAANEASAVGSLRTVNTAELTYSSTYGTGFTQLSVLGNSGLIDNVLGNGTKSGYTIKAQEVGGSGGGTSTNPYVQYTSSAKPINQGITGTRYFCSDESGVIRWETQDTCSGTSTALQ